MTTEDLLDLKEKVDAAKTAVSEFRGQLSTLKKQLKEDWGLATLEKAKEKLKELQGNIDNIDTKIEEGVAKLEDEYNISE